MPSGSSPRVVLILVLVLMLTSRACRPDAPGAGTVPEETEAEGPVAPNGDVIDPAMTVDTQRIPGADTLQ